MPMVIVFQNELLNQANEDGGLLNLATITVIIFPAITVWG